MLDRIDEAMQWIIFTQFLVELSDGSVPIIDYDSTGNKWMKTIYKIYLAFGHMNRISNWHRGKPVVLKGAVEPPGAQQQGFCQNEWRLDERSGYEVICEIILP